MRCNLFFAFSFIDCNIMFNLYQNNKYLFFNTVISIISITQIIKNKEQLKVNNIIKEYFFSVKFGVIIENEKLFLTPKHKI